MKIKNKQRNSFDGRGGEGGGAEGLQRQGGAGHGRGGPHQQPCRAAAPHCGSNLMKADIPIWSNLLDKFPN